MKHVSLEAWPRQTAKTSGAHRVREDGYIPGVLLGHHEPAVTIKVKTGDMVRVLKQGGPNALVDLTVDGQSNFAMIREFTRHPVSRSIIHVDFMRVQANEPIEAHVPVVIAGEPASEYDGFTVALELASVRVKALPDSLPPRLEVDAATLQPGHPLHARDLPLPEGVQLTEDPAHIIAILAAPTLRQDQMDEEAAVAEEGVENATTEAGEE